MVGLDSSSLVYINPLFKDRHILCEWLLCSFVHAGHISHVAVDYATHSIYHDDSCCGYHDSVLILDGMEEFLRYHLAWRRARGLRVRDDFSDEMQLRKVHSSGSTSSQHHDSDSFGIYSC